MTTPKKALGKVWIGTSGVVLPGPKHTFPEPFQSCTRLQYYSTLFNSVEINSTFYKLHKPATFLKWTSETNDAFKFTIKLWKEISHRKGLVFDVADVTRFFDSIKLMEMKKGCLLLQFPASVTMQYFHHLENLIGTISALKMGLDWHLCIEFRHKSWYCNDAFDLLRSSGTSIVHHDIPKSKPPLDYTDDKVIYLRFHGVHGDYRGSYPNETLEDYAELIQSWTKHGKDVYVYFNNTIGNAFENARYLRQTLAAN